MYTEYEGKLVITVNQWIEARLSKNVFEHESKSNPKGLIIIKRSLHGNTLIDVRSIKRLDLRAAIEKCYGIIEEQAKIIPIAQRIEIDQAAHAFFHSYTYGEKDDHLPVCDKHSRNIPKIYTNNASILNTLKILMAETREARASNPKGFRSGKWWADSVNFCKTVRSGGWINSLPTNPQAFERVFKSYLNSGYISLISGKYGNNNTEKICDEAKDWLIARWASFVNRYTLAQLHVEYNRICEGLNWKTIKSEQTLRNFLYKPEIEILWSGVRHGELVTKGKFEPKKRTILPEVRDALWYGDGTKINLYYQDENRKPRTAHVYEVMDAATEVFLGYYISNTENFEEQYRAYRMALNFSCHKPYEVRFDNQGGHKKLMAGTFFSKMAHLAIATKPYNGSSKTIESAFGRFQAQYLHRHWNFTGQNITTTKQESRVNMEAILDNKANLPSYEEMVKIYESCRNEWNAAPHPKTGVSRTEMYYTSKNEKAVKIKPWERINLFGILNDKPCKFTSSGIEITVKGIKYAYDVMLNGLTDIDFRKRYTGKTLFIEYDFDDMSIVNLYEETANGLRFVAMAEKHIVIHRAIQDQDEFDAKYIVASEKQGQQMRIQTREQIEALMERQGVHPAQQGLRMPKLRGISRKKQAAVLDSPLPKKRVISLEKDPMKEISEMTMLEVEGKY